MTARTTKRPTAAAVRKVIQVYEREVYNPVNAWLQTLSLEQYPMLAADLDMLHHQLKSLHDDVRQGLVDWEGE